MTKEMLEEAEFLGRQVIAAEHQQHARHRAPFARPFRLKPVKERFAAKVGASGGAADPKAINALARKLRLRCVNIVGNKGVNPVGMGLCNHPDFDYKRAAMQAYNRWISEYCDVDRTRLLALGQTPMRSPEEGIKDLEKMKAMGLKLAMISGDNARTARAIARDLGIDEVVAEVLPDGKVDAVKRGR